LKLLSTNPISNIPKSTDLTNSKTILLALSKRKKTSHSVSKKLKEKKISSKKNSFSNKNSMKSLSNSLITLNQLCATLASTKKQIKTMTKEDNQQSTKNFMSPLYLTLNLTRVKIRKESSLRSILGRNKLTLEVTLESE